MKIVSIFAQELFAFHYDDEQNNEFDRLLDLWTDVAYLMQYAKKNKIKDIQPFVEKILSDANEIEDLLEEITKNKKTLGLYFKPLDNKETSYKILSLQKGKINKNILRIYAIRIDDNLFVITGGAIKMSHYMNQHPDTANELIKLNAAQSFLCENGVFDCDSFFELQNETK